MNKTYSLTALIAAIAVLLIAPLAKADDPVPAPAPSTGAGAARNMRGQFANLDLTADQKSKIKPIMMSLRAQIKALKADTTLTDEQRKAQEKQLRQSAMAQVAAILTDQQKEILKADKKGAAAAKRGALADLAYLNLTADQTAQLDQIKSSARTQLDAVKADTTLTEQQKKQKARPIYESAVKQFIAILTPDQATQFRAHMQQAASQQAAR